MIHFLSKLFCGICGIYVIQLNFYEFLIVFRFLWVVFCDLYIFKNSACKVPKYCLVFLLLLKTRERDRILGIEFFYK